MSALSFKLLLYLCVWSSVLQANGIQNLRYPTRFDSNQLRFGKRQDFLTKSRLFMWKPQALNSGQMYPNMKTPGMPLAFNRYGIPPQMAPIHQNYMFAIPTKVNYPSYQPIKEVDDKRKPGNLHHITIINAIMPKPYLPTVPTHSHPTTFRNYRTNSKLLYHQYFNNNFARQNMENFNKINMQQLQLQQLQQQQQQQLHQHHQQQQQNQQMVYPSPPLAYNINTPTNEYRNANNYNTNYNNNNIEHENEINSPVSQCGRKAINDSNQSASNVMYYYCNNRITNYKNPTQQQLQLVSIPPTTSSTSSTSTTTTSTTTTTTTTEAPTTTTHSTKSARLDYDFFPTEKPIFLPTPIAPLENSFTPIASTTSLSNSIADYDNDNNDLKPQSQKYRPKKYEDVRTPHQRQRYRQSVTRYDDIKRQQPQYTTAAATFDDMKLHSFFTIEDAVTRAPEMQVFNDPYQAYRHARRHHHSHQRQTITTTTTKKPDTTTTTTTTTTTRKPKFKSFFDDLDDDDYTIPEVPQYDYSVFSNTPKSVYRNSELHNDFKFPEHNQIIDHTHKPTEDNEFFPVDEPYYGKPKIKQHNFGLFQAITSTAANTTPIITTYKPYNNFRDLFLTTHKIPHLSSYELKPFTSATTTETELRNFEPITEKENTTSNVFANEVRTSTAIPITTTTEKKSNRITLKSPLTLRSPTTYKYPKQNGIRKSYKSLTSTTTRATPLLKKVPKYQRQYKTKKLKQFKHLFTTSSTTTSTTTTTTTTAIPSTETPTKRISIRLLPTTSTTEEPTTTTTTKRAPITRTFSTTEATKVKKVMRQQPIITTTEATSRKKIKSRTSAAPTGAAVNNTSTRRQSTRRGTKRANIPKSEVKKETLPSTTRKTENKSRRRPTTSTTTTVKPFITRTVSSTSTTTPSPISTNLRTSSTTTTTMKSIMRIANSKARTKLHKEVKTSTPTKTSKGGRDERKDFDERMSLKSITSTISSVPPLPIEIYFKKSHNAKI